MESSWMTMQSENMKSPNLKYEFCAQFELRKADFDRVAHASNSFLSLYYCT
ncbi:hypothetical protein Fmac_032226 [Flemingia macrophylla]|uniref:Uncharacterized protein n=1 Tax=Flemingia macrophylla TaxID=520843 RepID=A0ABD1L5N5_9FABA